MTEYQKELQQWQSQATDYPTKALLYVAEWLYAQQEERLQQLAGQLDGTMWSPAEWQK